MTDSQRPIDALSCRAELSGFAGAGYTARLRERERERGAIRNRKDSALSEPGTTSSISGTESGGFDSLPDVSARKAQIVEEHYRNRLDATIGIKNGLIFGTGIWILSYLSFSLVSQLF